MSRATTIFQTGNPFPPVPAARLGGFASTFAIGATPDVPPVTVPTAALEDLREQVDDYFAQPPGSRTRGRAVALVGMLGVGKTHLTRDVTARIRGHDSDPLLWIIDEATGDLGAVYRGRLMNLGDDRNRQAAFEEVITDYYSDVTAAELERDPARTADQEEIVQGLRNRELDPGKVVDSFDINADLIYQDLHRHLSEITEHRQFATALALLQDRQFRQVVWDWLAGGPPAPVLVERGITAPIDGIGQVFDVLTVFAFLYGRLGKPYALVIDSLEKALDLAEGDRVAFVDGFERLVNAYTSMGGLLIFCIPPGPLSRLRASLHERILQIWPTGLDTAQTAELISGTIARYYATLRQTEGAGGPWPDPGGLFTPAAVAEIRELTEGTPRQILKICHHAWETAADAEPAPEHIDTGLIHRAVRTIYEKPRNAVLTLVREILESGQWHAETSATRFRHRVPGDAERVDFWIEVGDDSALAVLIVESVLEPGDLEAIRRVARAVHEDVGQGRAKLLVVVNGHLSETMRHQVAGIVRTQPVVYSTTGFTERFRRAITELVTRLEADRQASLATDLRLLVGRLAADQNATLQRLQRLDARMDDLHATAASPATGIRPAPGPAAELPEPVRVHFDRAFRALERADLSAAELARDLGAGHVPRRLDFAAEQVASLGVVALVRRLLEAFCDGVAHWLRTVRATAGGPTPRQRHDLFVLCRSFGITTEVLPLGRLGGPAAVSPAGIGRRSDTEETFGDLAQRVFDSALRAAHDAAASGDRRA